MLNFLNRINKLILLLIKIRISKFRGLWFRSIYLKIGKNSFIANNVHILGLKNLKIGDHCTIGENTSITINNRYGSKLLLNIGDNVYIGRDNFFTVGGYMQIGDYCIFGNRCAFISSDHDFSDPLIPYALSGATSKNKIQIGPNCWLGNNVTVIGDITIGHGSIIGANSTVLNNIPPFSVVVGNPARVIKRFDFTNKIWIKNSTEHFVDLANDMYDEKKYRNYLKHRYSRLPIAYHSASSKFGDL